MLLWRLHWEEASSGGGVGAFPGFLGALSLRPLDQAGSFRSCRWLLGSESPLRTHFMKPLRSQRQIPARSSSPFPTLRLKHPEMMVLGGLVASFLPPRLGNPASGKRSSWKTQLLLGLCFHQPPFPPPLGWASRGGALGLHGVGYWGAKSF